MGIVFLEAMAFGKPVIGGRYGGTPEIVRHEETGILVDHDDVDELSAALTRLLASPTLRSRLGKAARQQIVENYTFVHCNCERLCTTHTTHTTGENPFAF